MQVITDFEARKQRIDQLETDVVRHEEALVQHRNETTAVKQRWLEPVKDLVGRISRNFSQYFAAMKCAGEVDVSVPDNPVRQSVIDQKKYVVQSVIFRPSKITNFVQNFVQISNFRPSLVQLLKGI